MRCRHVAKHCATFNAELRACCSVKHTVPWPGYLSSEACCLQDARIYCQEIRDTIKILKSNRDMAFNEIKLTVMIEDPRARERRENLGIEVRSLCTCMPECLLPCSCKWAPIHIIVRGAMICSSRQLCWTGFMLQGRQSVPA
jgi:hypothetical protein